MESEILTPIPVNSGPHKHVPEAAQQALMQTVSLRNGAGTNLGMAQRSLNTQARKQHWICCMQVMQAAMSKHWRGWVVHTVSGSGTDSFVRQQMFSLSNLKQMLTTRLP